MSMCVGKINRKMFLAQLLYECVEDNRIEAVQFLLQKGANPNTILPKKGISSFHLAVGCDKIFALQATNLILKYGGDPNVRSEDGLTPVHITAAWGSLEILHLLLTYGGDSSMRDDNFMTPMDYAKQENQTLCLQLMERFIPAAVYEREGTGMKIKLDEASLVSDNEKIEYKADSIPEVTCKKALDLPEASEGEYVENWIEKHLSHNKTDFSTDSSSDVESINPNVHSNESHIFCTPKRIIPETPINITLSNTSNISKSTFNDSERKPPSCESGIIVLSNSFESSISNAEANSHYVSCVENNLQIPTKHQECQKESKDDLSFVTVVSEVYKYEDKEKDIVLYEQRLLKSPECDASPESGRSLSSVPDSFIYDSDTLRKELTLHGCDPGPITFTTKKVYLKKLYNLKKHPTVQVKSEGASKIFSFEIEKTRTNVKWFEDNMELYKSLEDAVSRDFDKPNPMKKWREGINKASFNYILLDPRITNNLPCRAETSDKKDIWEIFLASIFYIGKGKKSRPYAHLYDAVSLWKEQKYNSDNKKLNYILDIWNSNCGVICLHIFHNIIPVEAYTREAAMISALTLNNTTNIKSGEYYGAAASWPQKHKKIFGTYLLYKAMNILLNDGERQIHPCDIDCRYK